MKLPSDLGNAEERWNEIVNFISQWTNQKFILSPDMEKIREYEEKLQVTLPVSVRNWIAFSHQLQQMKHFDYRDYLAMKWLKNFDALCILSQAEGDSDWAVKREHLVKDDPPVTNYYLEYSTDKFEELGEWNSSLSSFSLEYFFTYSWDKISCQKFPSALTQDDLKTEFQFIQNGSLNIYYKDNIVLFTSTCKYTAFHDQLGIMSRKKILSKNVPSILKKAGIKLEF